MFLRMLCAVMLVCAAVGCASEASAHGRRDRDSLRLRVVQRERGRRDRDALRVRFVQRERFRRSRAAVEIEQDNGRCDRGRESLRIEFRR